MSVHIAPLFTGTWKNISSNGLMGLKKTYPATKPKNSFTKFAITSEILMGNFSNLCQMCVFWVGHFSKIEISFNGPGIWGFGSILPHWNFWYK